MASLDHFVARSYGPGAGRFLSPDAPFADQKAEDPQSWNLCGYVRNNPLRYVDPSGMGCLVLPDGTEVSEKGNYSLFINNSDCANAALVDQTIFRMTVIGNDQLLSPESQAIITQSAKLAEGPVNAMGVPLLGFLGTAVPGSFVEPTLTLGSVPWTSATFQRVMSTKELEATQATGLLRGGRDGENFFTNAASLDPKRAQIRLGLDGPLREQRVSFQITDKNVAISGPRVAKPGTSGTPGGGTEFSTSGRTPITILRKEPMRR